MEYSIQQLSHLAGVSTRTLRWYDKIGLLKPNRVAENGYRYYNSPEVDRLQEILYYRALGVGLAQIKTSLDDPSFQRLAALRSHLSALKAEQERIQVLVESVKETIRAEERNEIMRDEAKFRAFKQQVVAENEAKYGAEIRAKYGSRLVDDANAAVLNLSPEQYQAWEQLGAEILERLNHAVPKGEDPTGETGRELTALHRRWLTTAWGRYEPARHKGVAMLYGMDQRFTDYYDKTTPGCAEFLRDAVCHWADQLEQGS